MGHGKPEDGGAWSDSAAESSTSSLSDVEELESDDGEVQRIEELVRSTRWECPVCLTGSKEAPGQSLWQLRGCGHRACSDCIAKSVQHLSRRCPQCREPLDPLDIVAHTSQKQWVHAEQDEAWTADGCRGIRCSRELCHGVILRPEPLEEGRTGMRRVNCGLCSTGHCARCGEPWLQSHTCEDFKAAERERAERERAEREWAERAERAARALRADREARLAARQLPEDTAEARHSCCLLLLCNALGFRTTHRLSAAEVSRTTHLRVAAGDQYRPCPRCKVMTAHDGGCNMMKCPVCRLEWCFACGGDGSAGCTHFKCGRVALELKAELAAAAILAAAAPARGEALL